MDGRDELLQQLQGCLSVDPHAQKTSEAAVRHASGVPGYGAALVGIVQREDVEPGVRQLAAVLLKQLVKAHWVEGQATEDADGTVGAASFVVSESEKGLIRESVVSALLRVRDSKICTAVSVAISTIADLDWPHQWPALVDRLLGALSDPSRPTPVLASLRCLALVAESANDSHLPLLVRQTFPTLLTLVSSSQSVAARAGALQVVHACISPLALMRGAQQREAADLLNSVLPAWIPHLLAVLQYDVTSSWTSSHSPEWAVRLEALKCLTRMVQNCAPVVEPKLAEILACLWQSWVSSIPAYEAGVVAGAQAPLPDSEGRSEGAKEAEDLAAHDKLESVAGQTFEFILSLTQSSKFQEQMRAAIEAVVYFAVPFMQITADQEETWVRDPNQFISDEEEDVISCRSSGCLLSEELVQVFEDASLEPISVAVQRRLVDSTAARQQGNPLWWKLREAAIMAVGSVADKFIGSEMSGVKAFDSQSFLDMLLNHDLAPGGASDLPLLYSRCLWACGRFCPVAGPDRLRSILQRSIEGMDPSRHPVVHVGACRALSRVVPNTPQELLQQFIQQIYAAISGLLPGATDEVLRIILELLETVVRAGKQATAAVESGMTPAILAIWADNVNDPVISCGATDVLEAIADSPDCFGPLVSKALPFLRGILEGGLRQEGGDGDGKVAGAIEIVTMLLKRSSQGSLRPIFDAVFAPLVQILLTSSDHEELQNGAEALAAFVRVGGDALLVWSGQPEATMKLLLDVAARLLSPELEPSASAFVGPYLEQLLCRFPSHIGPHMHSFVLALVARISTKSLPTLTTSLLLVFSRLIHICDKAQRVQLVSFLASAQAPGQDCSSLVFLSKEWCRLQGEIQSRQKASMAASALALLLATHDPRLDSIAVEACAVGPSTGSPVLGSSQRVRARPTAEHLVPVPFPIKCLSFFVEMVSDAEEVKAQRLALQRAVERRRQGGKSDEAGEDEGDEDDEEDDDEDDDEDEEDKEGDELVLRTDFMQILQDYLLAIPQPHRLQLSHYRDLFTGRQQKVLQHYLGLSDGK